MKHEVLITPLNASFAVGMNSFLRMEETEYNADTIRSIYCRSPIESWFKMKAVSATPYIEPTFYGVKPGDVVDIEFEAMLINGNITNMSIPIFTVSSGYVATLLVTEHTGSLKKYYKKYKFKYVIPTSFNGIGILFNIRPNVNVIGNEVIIKNIKVTIDTKNHEFSLVNNIVSFKTKTDFMQCIDYITGTNLYTVWNGLKTVFDAGEVFFPDDNTLQFSGIDVANFKGLATCFNGSKYRPCVAVYCEYVTDGTNDVIATLMGVSEGGVVVDTGAVSFPATSSIKKKLQYINGNSTVYRKFLIDLGRVVVNNFSLKNVYFSMPQFDDSIKREPNKLEELYTNLRGKLR